MDVAQQPVHDLDLALVQSAVRLLLGEFLEFAKHRVEERHEIIVLLRFFGGRGVPWHFFRCLLACEFLRRRCLDPFFTILGIDAVNIPIPTVVPLVDIVRSEFFGTRNILGQDKRNVAV